MKYEREFNIFIVFIFLKFKTEWGMHLDIFFENTGRISGLNFSKSSKITFSCVAGCLRLCLNRVVVTTVEYISPQKDTE